LKARKAFFSLKEAFCPPFLACNIIYELLHFWGPEIMIFTDKEMVLRPTSHCASPQFFELSHTLLYLERPNLTNILQRGDEYCYEECGLVRKGCRALEEPSSLCALAVRWDSAYALAVMSMQPGVLQYVTVCTKAMLLIYFFLGF
jgi:hypothetical protein